MANIKEIHYASRDPWAGSTNLLQATPSMRKKKIKAFGPKIPEFETAIMALNTDFALRHQRERFQKVLDTWMNLYPEITHMAMSVFESGILPKLKVRDFSSEQLLIELSEHII
jgi:hypothetical protein